MHHPQSNPANMDRVPNQPPQWYAGRTTSSDTINEVFEDNMWKQKPLFQKSEFKSWRVPRGGWHRTIPLSITNMFNDIKVQRPCKPIHTTYILSLNKTIYKMCSVCPRIISHKMKSGLAVARKSLTWVSRTASLYDSVVTVPEWKTYSGVRLSNILSSETRMPRL